MTLKAKIAEIRDTLLLIADAIRGPVIAKVQKPLNLKAVDFKGFKENVSAQSVATMLQTAAAELDSLNFDAAERQLTTAQKKWAAIIKEKGRSKELSKLLDIIINLKQKIKDAKTGM